MESYKQYWNPNIETMPKEELKQLQLKRLISQVDYVYKNSQFYRKLYSQAGVTPEDIKSLEDYQKRIPIIQKDDIRKDVSPENPFGGVNCVPSKKLMIWVSTGTSGVPTFGGRTREDLILMIENLSRSFWAVGFRPGTKVIQQFGNWHWSPSNLVVACNRMGVKQMMVIGASIGPFAQRAAVLTKYFKPDFLVLPATFTQLMIQEAIKMGEEPTELFSGIKKILISAEVLTPLTRKRLKEKAFCNAEVHFYAGGGESQVWPVDSCYPECDGGHLWEDLVLSELIDPETRELILGAERGEQVTTNIATKGTPYLRFDMEDLVDMYYDSCVCGRTHPRVTIIERADWQIKVAGKTIVPFDVRTIFEEFPETEEAIFKIQKYSQKMDKLKIVAEYDRKKTKDRKELRERLRQRIKEKLGLESEIEWGQVVVPSMDQVTHKIVRIEDLTKEKK
ncbi:MAG: hypothetical protein KIH10_11405 [Candidatus Freyarchaeota archaeon]|nr:hypothetical protein [Candidatus Jordarchaeia archaeon]MBS7280306.1 hypothetical protein [Candidatus Jordarchaeia archaeon]